jgi:DNA-binding GntR family transcriptional regulator
MDAKFTWLEQRTTTPDGVYAVLRAAILDGTVPAGGQLREAHIAADLGISRSPLREALTRLEEEGLVVKIPFRGAFVVEVSARDVADIASIRVLVEPYAAELSAEALRGSERPGLMRTIEELHRALLRPFRARNSAESLEWLGGQAASLPHDGLSYLQRPA